MNLRNMLCAAAVTLVGLIGNAQSPQTIADMAGFEYYAVNFSHKSAIADSTRFIISKPEGGEQAVLVFVQGSGNQSVIIDNGKLYYALTDGLMDRETRRKYRVVLITKHGATLSSSSELATVAYAPTRGQYEIFSTYDFLDFRIEALRQTIQYLRDGLGLNLPVYLVGHSQGYKICARFAATYPLMADKVVCLSNSPFQNSEELTERYNELLREGKLSISQLADSIRTLNQPYESSRGLSISILDMISPHISMRPEQFLKFHFGETGGQQSFNTSVLGDMLRIQCPLLVCYGSNDSLATLSGLLPAIFRKENNHNLTLKRFERYNHQFEYQQVAGNGIAVASEPGAAEVFRYVDSWLNR